MCQARVPQVIIPGDSAFSSVTSATATEGRAGTCRSYSSHVPDSMDSMYAAERYPSIGGAEAAFMSVLTHSYDAAKQTDHQMSAY